MVANNRRILRKREKGLEKHKTIDCMRIILIVFQLYQIPRIRFTEISDIMKQHCPNKLIDFFL